MEGGGNDARAETFFYGKCMKNHYANHGGTVTDGCGEYLQNEQSPNSLRCDVCGCHRNFHQKTPFLDTRGNNEGREDVAVADTEAPPTEVVELSSDEDKGRQQHDELAAAEAVVSLARPNATETVVEPLVVVAEARRRPRTIFTDQQKRRMRSFAESIGWRMAKDRNQDIDTFCQSIGVSRQNFRIWMHNNKSTSSPSMASMGSAEPSGTVGRNIA